MGILILVVAVQVSAQTFVPGLWSSKRSFEVDGLPMPSASDKNCITATQAKHAKSTIETELKKQGCTITKWSLKDKKLDADLICKSKDLDATGKLSGDFTPKSYDLKGEAKGKYKSVIPATAKLELSGQWIKECVK